MKKENQMNTQKLEKFIWFSEDLFYFYFAVKSVKSKGNEDSHDNT